MLRRGGREARFALVSDGYARDQVDTVVEQYERQFGETKVQLERTDLNLAEADSRLRARIDRFGFPANATSTSGWSRMLRNQAG